MAVPGTADQEEVGVPARSSLAQSVFDVLMAEIVRVERRPGEPLNKDEIAAQLGVSRQPVTDAINRLAAMGLATVIPQVNSYVSRISASDVVESSFVRSAVEAEVVHILASRPRPALVTPPTTSSTATWPSSRGCRVCRTRSPQHGFTSYASAGLACRGPVASPLPMPST
jgi:DNA-binding transcriptional MocR family regulator